MHLCRDGKRWAGDKEALVGSERTEVHTDVTRERVLGDRAVRGLESRLHRVSGRRRERHQSWRLPIEPPVRHFHQVRLMLPVASIPCSASRQPPSASGSGSVYSAAGGALDPIPMAIPPRTAVATMASASFASSPA